MPPKPSKGILAERNINEADEFWRLQMKAEFLATIGALHGQRSMMERVSARLRGDDLRLPRMVRAARLRDDLVDFIRNELDETRAELLVLVFAAKSLSDLAQVLQVSLDRVEELLGELRAQILGAVDP